MCSVAFSLVYMYMYMLVEGFEKETDFTSRNIVYETLQNEKTLS